jgi:integrase
VRDGKGRKDRVTMLPRKLAAPLRAHLDRVRRQHESDLGHGHGSVELPGELARKYPRAAGEWAWQWVFPATRLYRDRATGHWRRHHLHETVMQRNFKSAVRAAGVTKPASCHTLRHYAGSGIMPAGNRNGPDSAGFLLSQPM